LHQVGDLFELNIKLRCWKFKLLSNVRDSHAGLSRARWK